MSRNFKKSFYPIIILLGIFSFAFYTNAQNINQVISGIQNNIEVTLSPKFPKAGDQVNIHLESYTTDLNGSKISWIVNGKTVSSDRGLTDFTATAGKVGSTLKVMARIVTTDGTTIEKMITIQPADIDILWQSESSVPPFYEGKALYPHQGLITFTAIPSVSGNKDISKSIKSYIYKWKKDGDVLGDFSGYGKNTFTLRGTIISRPFTIEVEVSSTDGVSLGSASTLITPRTTEVAFYENNPLLGVLYNRKLSNYSMSGKEFTIAATPYYFNSGSEPVNLKYLWTMNSNIIENQRDPSVITVRNTSGAEGDATIGVQISNLLKTLQFSSNSMTISFSKPKETSI